MLLKQLQKETEEFQNEIQRYLAQSESAKTEIKEIESRIPTMAGHIKQLDTIASVK